MGNWELDSERGPGSDPDELERALSAVRDLGALILEARERAARVDSPSDWSAGDGELIVRIKALDAEIRTWGLTMLDPAFAGWVETSMKRRKVQSKRNVNKAEVLRLANLVSQRRRKYDTNRIMSEFRERSGSNRPDREVIESVPLSVVPRITTLEAALRVSRKIKRQLLINERIAAEAQTAKLSTTALKLLDLNHSVDDR